MSNSRDHRQFPSIARRPGHAVTQAGLRWRSTDGSGCRFGSAETTGDELMMNGLIADTESCHCDNEIVIDELMNIEPSQSRSTPINLQDEAIVWIQRWS